MRPVLQVGGLSVGGGQGRGEVGGLAAGFAAEGAGAGDPDGWAWGNAIPPGVCRVTALTVRVSRRPWPRSRRRSPAGICAQGRALSWANRVGWLALTGIIRWPPRAAISFAWPVCVWKASATNRTSVRLPSTDSGAPGTGCASPCSPRVTRSTTRRRRPGRRRRPPTAVAHGTTDQPCTRQESTGASVSAHRPGLRPRVSAGVAGLSRRCR